MKLGRQTVWQTGRQNESNIGLWSQNIQMAELKSVRSQSGTDWLEELGFILLS